MRLLLSLFALLLAAPTFAQVPRDRCDTVTESDALEILYKDAPREKADQVLQPASTFSGDAKVICQKRGNLDYPRKVVESQVESGVYQGFGYRVDYLGAYGKVTAAGEQDDLLADELWSVNCDVDEMDDSVSCYITREHLFLWYDGGDSWRVLIGEGRNYPGTEIAVRLDDAKPLESQEPTLTAEQAHQLVEGLKADPRVRTRYYKWPSGVGSDDFHARGFSVALDLVKWLYAGASP